MSRCDPAAYLHSRIRSWDGINLTFTYRDKAGNQQPCALSAQEFVRRLLQHVPPRGFQRVRHYGWLCGAAKNKWQRILALLDWKAPPPPPSTRIAQPIRCPACGKPLRLIGTLPRCPP